MDENKIVITVAKTRVAAIVNGEWHITLIDSNRLIPVSTIPAEEVESAIKWFDQDGTPLSLMSDLYGRRSEEKFKPALEAMSEFEQFSYRFGDIWRTGMHSNHSYLFDAEKGIGVVRTDSTPTERMYYTVFTSKSSEDDLKRAVNRASLTGTRHKLSSHKPIQTQLIRILKEENLW